MAPYELVGTINKAHCVHIVFHGSGIKSHNMSTHFFPQGQCHHLPHLH